MPIAFLTHVGQCERAMSKAFRIEASVTMFCANRNNFIRYELGVHSVTTLVFVYQGNWEVVESFRQPCNLRTIPEASLLIVIFIGGKSYLVKITYQHGTLNHSFI